MREEDTHLLAEDAGPSGIEEYEPDQPTITGRITTCCTAAAYNIKELKEHMEVLGYRCKEYPEVVHCRLVRGAGESTGEIFLFEYGVAVFWDLTALQEESVLQNNVKKFEQQVLAPDVVEQDMFEFRYVPYSKPYIQNDVITMSPNLKDAALLKLSISFALSQSVKLRVVESRVLRMAAMMRPLPQALAKEGKVKISDSDIAKLMGRVFIENSQLNLLGSVLDTPNFFWEVPDAMQNIYDRVWDYLEMDDRVQIINTRLAVLHEMLDMLRVEHNTHHEDYLEWIIIWLISVDILVLLFQVAATLGLVKGGHGI